MPPKPGETGGLSRTNKKPCRLFQQGNCRFGNGCKFSHDKPNMNAAITFSNTNTNSNAVRPRQTTAAHASTSLVRTAHPERPEENSVNITLSSPQAASGSSANQARGGSGRRQGGAKRGQFPCQAWKQGNCTKGDKCFFAHDPAAREMEIQRQRQVAARVAAARHRAEEERRRAAEAARRQELEEIRRRVEEAARVERERLEAEQLVQERERQRQAEEERRLTRERAEREHREEQERQRETRRRAQEARKAEEDARRAQRMEETARKNAAATLKHLALGGTTLVTFSAGARIQHVVTGYQLCRVEIKNLPGNATRKEVCDLFTSQGISEERFELTSLKWAGADKQSAEVLIDEAGRTIALGLDGVEFRNTSLSFTVSEGGPMQETTGYIQGDPNTLIISWRAASVTYIATYDSAEEASAGIRALGGRLINGRRIKAEHNRAPPNAPRVHIPPNSVRVLGVPLDFPFHEFADLAGTHMLKTLKSNDYTFESVERNLRATCGVVATTLWTLERDVEDLAENKQSVKIRCNNPETAQRIYDVLDDQRFPWVGNQKLWLGLPEPFRYTLSIPKIQHTAQESLWNTLKRDFDTKERRIRFTGKNRTFVQVSGRDQKAVGMLKVQVQNLAAGLKLDGWHRGLMSPAGQTFVQRVMNNTRIFVSCDRRTKSVVLYGTDAAVQRARDMFREEFERFAAEEYSVTLKPQSSRYFIRHGVPALKETYGEESVVLDTPPNGLPTITVRGGEAVRHALDRHIQASLDDLQHHAVPDADGTQCPVCYDTVSSPVRLGCGHTYCTPCANHLLTTAAESKTFPLLCLGTRDDESRCAVPIPIPTIQQFLPQHAFDALLETVLISHIEQHPDAFRYCATPDCTQIYPCGDEALNFLRCPTCLSTVCTKCHKDAHEGLTCEQKLLQDDPEEQERRNAEWARAAGVKKCPRCSVWVEKTEGCNHITCRCGAHFCWRCNGIFDRAEIYDHMRDAHGGIGLGYEVENADELDRQARRVAEEIEREEQRRQGLRWGDILRRAEEERERQLAENRRLAEVRQRQREEEARRFRLDVLQRERQREEVARRRREEEERRRRENEGGWCVVM